MSRPLNRSVPKVGDPRTIDIDPFESDFNMKLAQPLSRSVRLNGFATCLRLENIYWAVLERIAQANGCTVNSVLSHVDREVHLRHGGVKNFSGLVRVICVVFLMNGGAQGNEEPDDAQQTAFTDNRW
ncbi:ribbon-helix-helix domain-containing protein [Pseudomonas japonica]|uniref:Predicted DNA-binding protein, contains Ribbon-helix-helix (RHH) domain n=1 Tax=Pseudomonas japonica TaxID=256466 RepID=A0A239FHX6_9PSED|nr:ribbon-helix-helix domain-containing protein [Pseudomonas japonica]SNS56128.1 Predicted DNA-binding protein, contains Ribbon-helix-helix (RHH) domain [Pseudomonas japonica]